MDDAARLQNIFITIQKIRVGKAVLGAAVFDLGIRERDPDFVHFVLRKEAVYQFHLCTEEGDVVQMMFNGFFSSEPKPRAFDVDSDEIVQRAVVTRASRRDFMQYFSQRENFKMLFACAWSWFALDVSNSTKVHSEEGFNRCI